MASRRAQPAGIRFWRHVAREAGGCWLWTGALAAGTGYGVFNRGAGKLVGAHCFAWELAHPDESRAGLVVRHICDQPRCVNPAHLQVGTYAQNTADMDARGRRVKNSPRGETHPAARLTDELVGRARAARRAGARVVDLARVLGVSSSTMADALGGRTWRGV